MKREGMTVRDAAEEWVREFNAIPQGVIQKLMELNFDDVQEITPPHVNDRVCILAGKHEGEYGRITGFDDDTAMYVVESDDGGEVELISAHFDLEGRDDVLPMWGTMWSFGDSIDNWWLEDEEQNGLQKMADCGFRIYVQEDIGYFFGIDGAGYSFMDEHFIPLYKARGLRWHKEEEDE